MICSSTYSLAVEVRDLFGLEVSGAEVEVTSPGQPVASGLTDGAGAWSAGGLVAGNYLVHVKYMGFVSSSEKMLSQDDRLLIQTPVSMNLILALVAVVVAGVIIIIFILRRRG